MWTRDKNDASLFKSLDSDYKDMLIIKFNMLLGFNNLCATRGTGTAHPSGAPEFTPQFFSGFCITRSLVLYVCFVDRCLSFRTFSFGHCVVCSSSIYRFWLPLWYLKTPLMKLLKSFKTWFFARLCLVTILYFWCTHLDQQRNINVQVSFNVVSKNLLIYFPME